MKRERVTITVREDLLKRIDDFVDGEQVRNRSHAIECLLSQSFRPELSGAFILAGGKGVRMKPLTTELPKSLLPVQGKPILEHQIQLLRDADIRDIVILIGHLGEKIKYHFGDGSKWGVAITYIEQEKSEIGTAHALLLAKNIFPQNPFLVLYGDVLARINLRDFINHHAGTSALATVALTSIKEPSLYGVAKMRGESVVEFTEKPEEKEELSRVISAGIFCFGSGIFDRLSSRKDLALETHVFPNLAREKKLNGYLFEGKWFDIGTQEIYERAIREWK